MLIAFEGLDGSGKTTIAKEISNELGLNYSHFPSSQTPKLHQHLKGEVKIREKALFLLFLHDIINNVRDGIVDRYVFSTIAYERDGIGFQNSKKIVELLNPKKPLLTIYIDIFPSTSLKRSKKEHETEKQISFLSEVRRRYLLMAEEQFLSKWYVVDGERALEEIKEDILNIIKGVLDEHSSSNR